MVAGAAVAPVTYPLGMVTTGEGEEMMILTACWFGVAGDNLFGGLAWLFFGWWGEDPPAHPQSFWAKKKPEQSAPGDGGQAAAPEP